MVAMAGIVDGITGVTVGVMVTVVIVYGHTIVTVSFMFFAWLFNQYKLSLI
jgi:hypothetical protein